MRNNNQPMDYWLDDFRAIHYEVTHQLFLQKLLQDPSFAKLFCSVDAEKKKVTWEPYRGKFDLGVQFENGSEVLIEIKMWSGLKEAQLKRQTEFLQAKPDRKGIYLLLGTSDYEYLTTDIHRLTHGLSNKKSYPELVTLIDEFPLKESDTIIFEMLESYKASLIRQENWLKNAWQYPLEVSRHFYLYSAFRQMRELMPELNTKISTGGKGSPDHIFNDQDSWIPYSFGEGKGYLYLEIINDEICIRFMNDPQENGNKHALRQHLIEKIFPKIKDKYPDANSYGKISKYMRIVRMPIDFKLMGIERVVEVFRDWHRVVMGLRG